MARQLGRLGERAAEPLDERGARVFIRGTRRRLVRDDLELGHDPGLRAVPELLSLQIGQGLARLLELLRGLDLGLQLERRGLVLVTDGEVVQELDLVERLLVEPNEFEPR